MLITILLVSIWVILMFRSSMAEYKYYQSIKIHETKIWRKLGSPTWVKAPFVYISSKASEQLKQITNKTVMNLRVNYRKTGIQFLAYVVFVLLASIIYFKNF